MIASGAFTGNVDIFRSKAWTNNDQLVSFSGPFIPNTQSTASFMQPVIVPMGLTDAVLKTGHVFSGQDITTSLLNQSLEYFQKALYNFNSQYLLAKYGFGTWAGVTNYYSSYFSIFSLLSLQGRAITRISLNGVNQTTCLLHPIDFRNHQYVLTTKENRDSSHKLPWNKYYDIYDQYACILPEYEIVQLKRFVTQPVDESEERNKINYKIYEGFQEIVSITGINLFRNQYLTAIATPTLGDTIQKYLTALYSLATDPDLMYFARSALRLVLIRHLFEEIGNVNAQFKAELQTRIPVWQSTMFDNYVPANNYYDDFVNVFLA
jgi:hypothetical protein